MKSNHASSFNNLINLNPYIELRFLISSKLAISMKEKYGVNMKNLRYSHLARINISENTGDERILSLESNLKTILDILRQSLDTIELSVSARGDSGEYSNQVDLRMLVNHSLVGALIGRGGGRINDLREKYDLRALKVYQNVCPSSTDRVVQMIGAMSPVMDCIVSIVDICKETPIKEPKANYDAKNCNPGISDQYGGWSPLCLTTPIGLGNSSLVFSKPVLVNSKEGSYKPILFEGSFNENNSDMENSFGGAPNDIQKQDPGAVCVTTLNLPHKKIGAIIGPGGSRIQQIRLESEADITISATDRNSQERTVTICGALPKVRRAQQMINECIHKYG